MDRELAVSTDTGIIYHWQKNIVVIMRERNSFPCDEEILQ
mgnify:CR=1 FL=1